jgi:hypothetical protein
MITVKYGGDIQRGDLIAVASGNYMSIGIYLGRGQGGSVQYLWPGSATAQKEWHDNKVRESLGIKPTKGPLKISQMGKNFVNTPSATRILKLNRENITDQETIEKLLTDKEVLKEFNIDVKY